MLCDIAFVLLIGGSVEVRPRFVHSTTAGRCIKVAVRLSYRFRLATVSYPALYEDIYYGG